MTISFEEFKAKGEDLQARIGVIKALFNEANALVESFDIDSLDQDSEQVDEAYDIAHELADSLNASFDSFGKGGGFWLPSTC